MTTTATLAGLLEQIGPLPIDPSWMYTVIRHGQRNMEIDIEEGFHEPDRQCGSAVGELINALPELLARIAAQELALTQCRDQFQFYADEHSAAGKIEKAATNQRFADLARAALTLNRSENDG